MDTAAPSVCADESLAEKVLAALRMRVGPQKFNAWFRRGARVEVTDHQLQVAVPNPFVARWIETHYGDDLADAAAEHGDRRLPVVVTIDPSLTGDCRKRQLDSQADIVRRTAAGRTRDRRRPAVTLRHRLADFVVGRSNRLAYSAAQAMAGRGQSPFGLLFLHGPCGVGKTHLLQGICETVRQAGEARWRYVTGEQFTNEYIAALRGKTFGEFRRRYRNLDLLAIDDVHFLAAKRGIQNEFLHTFDAVEALGSRIVLASDAHPKLVGDLSEKLISRFVSGMVVQIDPPDRQTRMEILKRGARRMRLHLADGVLAMVADHLHGSVRELEGALTKLAALSALSGAAVDVRSAMAAMSEHLARTGSAVTLDGIESNVATFFGITPADLHSSRRTRTVASARMVAMFLARRHTQMSFPEIGRAMGKNHSSVVLAVQRMEKLLAEGGEVLWQTPMGRRSMPATELIDLLTGQIA
ncbi:MAG: chromosomal replication initiator protein DnaA [Phycisphaerae bacterium]|nr:chromosomal replication initiator protein DnaA [Phycisphaerae bacterium]